MLDNYLTANLHDEERTEGEDKKNDKANHRLRHGRGVGTSLLYKNFRVLTSYSYLQFHLYFYFCVYLYLSLSIFRSLFLYLYLSYPSYPFFISAIPLLVVFSRFQTSIYIPSVSFQLHPEPFSRMALS